VLNYDPNTWHTFSATFVANATTGPLILAGDNPDPLYQSAVGADAIRVTRVRCVQPPVTVNDDRTGVASGTAVTIQVIGNDNDPENDIDPGTVNIVTPGATDSDGDGDMDTLTVPGEGIWTVDNTTGAITFTPYAGFTGDPTPIQYNVRDATGLLSNTATVSITYVPATGIAEGVPTLSDLAKLLLAMLLALSVYLMMYRRKTS
jgi:CshA-type fibril repeat protein